MPHHPRKRRANERAPKRRLKPEDAPAPTLNAGGAPASVPRRVILVKWPTRSRPQKLFSMLERYRSLESGKHEVRYALSCDLDDETMNNNDVKTKIMSMDRVEAWFGNNKTKIEAFNANMDVIDPNWDILIATSDDMRPMVKGWDNIVACEMEGEDAVWFYDGHAKGACTLSIMSRKKYEEQGYIYHPAYWSLFCDNEWTETAQPRFIPQVVIRHEWGRDRDKLLKHNQSFWDRDKAVYLDRKSKGFPK